MKKVKLGEVLTRELYVICEDWQVKPINKFLKSQLYTGITYKKQPYNGLTLFTIVNPDMDRSYILFMLENFIEELENNKEVSIND